MFTLKYQWWNIAMLILEGWMSVIFGGLPDCTKAASLRQGSAWV